MEFNWKEGELVFSTCQAVAVYFNEDGDVVIRQQGEGGEDDSVIIIPADRAETLSNYIREFVIGNITGTE